MWVDNPSCSVTTGLPNFWITKWVAAGVTCYAHIFAGLSSSPPKEGYFVFGTSSGKASSPACGNPPNAQLDEETQVSNQSAETSVSMGPGHWDLVGVQLGGSIQLENASINGKQNWVNLFTPLQPNSNEEDYDFTWK